MWIHLLPYPTQFLNYAQTVSHYFLLVDTRLLKGTNRAARTYKHPILSKIKQTQALIVQSTISKIAVNLYMNYSQQPYQLKVFLNDQTGLNWLAEEMESCQVVLK